MNEEKVKQLVSAAITFGTLSIPGFSDWLHAAGGTAEVMTLTGALYVVIHGIYERLHDNAKKLLAPAIMLALLMPAASASAQEPAPEHDRVRVFVGIAPTTGPMPIPRTPSDNTNLMFEADVRLPDKDPTDEHSIWLVGHVFSNEAFERQEYGLGPRLSYEFGLVHLFGHALVGNFGVGGENSIAAKPGGGVLIPLGRHAGIRFGADQHPDRAGDGKRDTVYGMALGLRF